MPGSVKLVLTATRQCRRSSEALCRSSSLGGREGMKEHMRIIGLTIVPKHGEKRYRTGALHVVHVVKHVLLMRNILCLASLIWV